MGEKQLCIRLAHLSQLHPYLEKLCANPRTCQFSPQEDSNPQGLREQLAKLQIGSKGPLE